MLGEVTDFELWQRAVRNQFQQGESVGSLLLGVGCLVAVVVLVLVIARLQARWNQREEKAQEESHPQRLYMHLICALGFTATQRHLLEAVAKASTLAHPAALLMSDVLFDQSVVQWERLAGEVHADARRIDDRRALAFARSRLFPEGRGIVQSASVRL
jgi:hypothetical protein